MSDITGHKFRRSDWPNMLPKHKIYPPPTKKYEGVTYGLHWKNLSTPKAYVTERGARVAANRLRNAGNLVHVYWSPEKARFFLYYIAKYLARR